jgi:PKD repeat protein
VHPVEGASFSGTVASFADPDTTGKASDYTATISWGDGAITEDATLVDDGEGVFHAVGAHTYKEEGSYPVNVTIQDDDTENLHVTDESLAEVADAPLHMSAHTDTTTTSGPALLWPAPPASGKLASFTDEDPEGTLSDYRAKVEWGDGATTPSATITPNGSGGWDVGAAHEYAQSGLHTVTVTVTDEGGSSISTTLTLIQFNYSLGGDFAIQSAPVGSQVTFWGSSWAAANPLIQAPSSFKGWADFASTPPSCNATWTTSPGNSSLPPLTVPAYMAVLETGPVSKSGSQISGKAKGVAIVHSNSGYGPDPGHPGTGTVIAQACAG